QKPDQEEEWNPFAEVGDFWEDEDNPFAGLREPSVSVSATASAGPPRDRTAAYVDSEPTGLEGTRQSTGEVAQATVRGETVLGEAGSGEAALGDTAPGEAGTDESKAEAFIDALHRQMRQIAAQRDLRGNALQALERWMQSYEDMPPAMRELKRKLYGDSALV